jgi:hypothetical protein
MPSPQKTQEILNFVADNPQDPRSIAATQKLGLSPKAIGAWKQVKDDPNLPQRTAVRNKVFNQIADHLPASQEGGGGAGFVNRLVVENLIDSEPELKQKYLQSKGFETRVNEAGDVEVKKPGAAQYSAIDPEGIDRFDLFDIGGDVLEGIVTGIATGAKALGLVGAPATGGASLAAASGLGAAATGGFEAARQGVGMAVGAREEVDPGRIAQSVLIGGAVPFAAPLLSKFGGKVLEAAPKLKPEAAAIKEAAKKIGAKATPGQLYDSRFIQDLEGSLVQASSKLGGLKLRGTVEANKKVLSETSEEILSLASGKTAFEIGSETKDQVLKKLAEKLQPAEEIYNRLEERLRRGAFKPEVGDTINKASQLVKKFKWDKGTVGSLKSYRQDISKAKNLTDIKGIRTAVRNEASMAARQGDFSKAKALGELGAELTVARSKTLRTLANNETVGDAADILQSLDFADKTYAESIGFVENALLNRGKQIKGGPLSSAKQFFEKTPETQIINKVLKTADPKKMQAVKEAFPEAFETLKTGKIQEILERSTVGGDINAKKLIKIINNMPPESARLIFDAEKKEAAAAMQTFLEDPSQTGKSLDFQNFLTGFSLLSQASSLLKSGALKAATKSGQTRELIEGIAQNQLVKPFASGLGARATTEIGIRQFMPPTESQGFNIPNGFKIPGGP